MLGRQIEKAVADGKMNPEEALAMLERQAQDAETGRRADTETRSAFRPLRRPGIPKMKIPESGIW
jgi:hypothetical protein